ncbi:DUF4376 domain-containing protein [Labrys neptuniae]|uniref:DUF4376 domain-containing protein n=1 Tax=Labrys neptuniae TaxID=376174 RepID=A0ABV3PGG1_9HYPH
MHLLVRDGYVVNVIEPPEDSDWAPPEGCILVEATGAIGDHWNGSACTAPSQVPISAPELLAYAADRRFAIETGGITLPNGAPIATDRDSQSLITGAWNYVLNSENATVSFKTAAGFVSMDADTLKQLALAVGDHVQKCFAAEGTIALAIATGTITTQADVDAAFASIMESA